MCEPVAGVASPTNTYTLVSIFLRTLVSICLDLTTDGCCSWEQHRILLAPALCT